MQHRRQAAAAGAQEPALQRLQVHRAGRGHAAHRPAPRRAGAPSTRPLEPRARGDRLRGHRHRHRHPAGQAADHLRGLPAGRRQHQPQVRRHRPRPGHQPRDRAPARRRDPAADERARRGQHLHPLPAPELRAARAAARGRDRGRRALAARRAALPRRAAPAPSRARRRPPVARREHRARADGAVGLRRVQRRPRPTSRPATACS